MQRWVHLERRACGGDATFSKLLCTLIIIAIIRRNFVARTRPLWITVSLHSHLHQGIAYNSALMLLVGRQERHPACKNWVVGYWHGYLSGATCRLAYMAQLMPLPLTVSCFSKIQTGFTFLVPAHPGSPGKMAVNRWVYSIQHSGVWACFWCANATG